MTEACNNGIHTVFDPKIYYTNWGIRQNPIFVSLLCHNEVCLDIISSLSQPFTRSRFQWTAIHQFHVLVSPVDMLHWNPEVLKWLHWCIWSILSKFPFVLYPINHCYGLNHASRPRGLSADNFAICNSFFIFFSFSRSCSSKPAIQLYLDSMVKCWDLILEIPGLFGFLGAAGESNHLHLYYWLITLSMLQGHILAKVITRMRVHTRIMNKEAV